ncbi:MAG: hypothetical protein CMP95_07530 [Gammaproteobacteria bacterium]|nr:hypothetical protein [Gammaproteobacteria bacterium]OUV67866.1 MAG: hypothetical protein CBC93_03875 [Gammaproteobacteria bacterium TMED133]
MKNLGRMESGVALISVLLLVVIITVVCVSMIRNQNFAIHQVRNSYGHTQVALYALGGEELARQILWQDHTDSPGIDHLKEPWAKKNIYFEFEDGEVMINIIDLQSKFNVNSLVLEGDRGSEMRRRFTKLLLDTGVDSIFLHRLLDWIDEDGAARALGAEDYDYLGLDLPYRTSGQPYTDLTELNLILDMDMSSFEQLQESLSVLPGFDIPLNINTAELGILNTLPSDLTSEVDNGIGYSREAQGPYNSIAEFLQSSPMVRLAINEVGLSVQSNFFEVQIRAQYGDSFGYLTSVIQRENDGSMRVISRNRSRKVLPMKESDDLKS